MPPKPAPTHFLCVPLVNSVSRPQATQSLAAFLADVTNPASFGVPEEAVRPVGTLHLTLGVFSFPRNEGLDRAKEMLRSLKPREILAGIKPPTTPETQKGQKSGAEGQGTAGTLAITLRGLESMQAASKAAVLYAAPTDQLGMLQAFCEKLREPFQEAGLMTENRPLLLHATILNTIYVKGGRDRRKGGKRGERLTIDARGILDRYEDQVWMEDVPVKKIAICKMGAKVVHADGIEEEAYEVVEEIEL